MSRHIVALRDTVGLLVTIFFLAIAIGQYNAANTASRKHDEYIVDIKKSGEEFRQAEKKRLHKVLYGE